MLNLDLAGFVNNNSSLEPKNPSFLINLSNKKPFAYHIISTKDWILEQYYTDIKFIARNGKAQRD